MFKEKNYSDFFEEVKVFEQLLKKSKWAKDVRFWIEINKVPRELLIKNTPFGLRREYHWCDDGRDNQILRRLSDREKFWQKMNEFEADASLGKKVRLKMLKENKFDDAEDFCNF